MKLFDLDFNCAIFDMDGTLLDSMEMWHTASDKYLVSKGKIPEKNLWDKVKWLNMTETVDYLISKYGLSEDTIGAKPKDKKDKTEDDFEKESGTMSKTMSENKSSNAEKIQKEILRQIQDEYENNLQLKEGAKELLKTLNENKIPCILATATDRSCVIPCIKRLGIEKYFTAVITCLDLNTSKSKPLIFEKAAELGNSTPENSLVFEDALHALRTAHNAGFKTCAVYDKSDEEKTEPPETDWQRIIKIADIKIKSLKEAAANLR